MTLLPCFSFPERQIVDTYVTKQKLRGRKTAISPVWQEAARFIGNVVLNWSKTKTKNNTYLSSNDQNVMAVIQRFLSDLLIFYM